MNIIEWLKDFDNPNPPDEGEIDTRLSLEWINALPPNTTPQEVIQLLQKGEWCSEALMHIVHRVGYPLEPQLEVIRLSIMRGVVIVADTFFESGLVGSMYPLRDLPSDANFLSIKEATIQSEKIAREGWLFGGFSNVIYRRSCMAGITGAMSLQDACTTALGNTNGPWPIYEILARAQDATWFGYNWMDEADQKEAMKIEWETCSNDINRLMPDLADYITTSMNKPSPTT